MFTDRQIYAVGEKILFKALNVSNPELLEACWSKVLYLELMTPDGTTVAHGKYSMTCTGTQGYLMIPENLLTGNYYLVTYTKWMRNFPVSDFAFCRFHQNP